MGGAPAADWSDRHSGDEHGCGEAVNATDGRVARDLVREDDVEREEGGVCEREDYADRLCLELDVVSM
jgi:hypothetical protein